jgi:DNA polymerase III subunit tau, C-terminal domain
LAVAVDDMRQGGDPRLPLELALIKVTRPGADLERESLAFRIEQLERRGPGDAIEIQAAAEPQEPTPSAPTVELEQLQDVWQRAVIPAVEQRSIPTASVLREAHPTSLAGDTLTLEFPATAGFHRNLAEEPKNATLLADALYEVTGRRFALAFEVGENGETEPEEQRRLSEEELVEELKQTFDAREVTPE